MLDINQSYGWIRPGDAVPPVFEPEDVESASQWIRSKNESQAGVLIAGGASHWFLGNEPETITDIFSVRKWNRVVEHIPGDLTITVESGCPLLELNEGLKKAGQFLPFFPVHSNDATIGGTVATGLSGPYGAALGRPRDYLIGIEVLHPEGSLSHAGGKVVKNVAGYDLCKLYCGSLGALGVITRMTFKLRPRPQHSATALLRFHQVADLAEAAWEIRSRIEPAAMEILRPGPQFMSELGEEPNDLESGSYLLAIQALDTRPLVKWKTQALRDRFPAIRLVSEKEERDFWQNWQQDFRSALQIENGRTVIRIDTPLSKLAEVCEDLFQRFTSSALTGHLGAGTLFGFLEGSEFLSGWESFRHHWSPHHVFSTLFKADAKVKRQTEVWGPTTQPLDIMKKIKQRFDPNGILNPGRFWGRL